MIERRKKNKNIFDNDDDDNFLVSCLFVLFILKNKLKWDWNQIIITYFVRL